MGKNTNWEFDWDMWHKNYQSSEILSFKVSGINYENEDGISRIDVISKMDKYSAIDIISEPFNKYDKNALAVYSKYGKIGYVPKNYIDDVREIDMMNIQKAAVIGCGFVGASTAFSLVQKGLFSELVLIDANKEKAEGEAMDLSHGRPFVHSMKIYAGDYDDISDCALIIITAGANQKPGETRLDLVHKNVAIFKSIIPEITKRNFEGNLLIVANPVDILTYAALKISGYPKERVFGSGTVLDSARFRYLLSEHLDVDSRSVHAFIIGEHGDSELAVWSSANVAGIDIHDFCELRGHYEHDAAMERIYKEVRDSAYEIIERKGATYYGVAMAVGRIAESIIRDENSVLPVSSLMEGEYGLEDLCISVPTLVSQKGAEQVLEIPLDEKEHKKLRQSAAELKKVLETLDL